MIYQFEREEINICGYCPCWDSEYACYWGKSYNNAQKPSLDCPLVAIPKTETTSCEWCCRASNHQRIMDELQSTNVYCPNCGRKLEE